MELICEAARATRSAASRAGRRGKLLPSLQRSDTAASEHVERPHAASVLLQKLSPWAAQQAQGAGKDGVILNVSADQFLAQCDTIIAQFMQWGLSQSQVTQIRECFLGVYWVLKSHETTIAQHEATLAKLTADLRALQNYVKAVVTTHGLSPTKHHERALQQTPSAGVIIAGLPGE